MHASERDALTVYQEPNKEALERGVYELDLLGERPMGRTLWSRVCDRYFEQS